jgi:hypothetical protein
VSVNAHGRRRFLEFARDNGTLPDIVSWHSWSANGEAIPGEVSTMRRYLEREQMPYEGLAINEMIYWDEFGQPGSTVANYMNVESIGSGRGCEGGMACPMGNFVGAIDTNWFPRYVVGGALSVSIPDGGRVVEHGLQPVKFHRRAVWHAHAGYGNLTGQMLNLSSAPVDVAALATVTHDGASVHVLVAHSGRRADNSTALALTLVLQHCDEGAPGAVANGSTDPTGSEERVAWLAHITPDVTNCSSRQSQHQPPDPQCAITNSSLSSPSYSRVAVAVVGGAVSVELPVLRAQEVLSIRVAPGCAGVR